MRRLLIALAMVAALTLGPATTALAQGGGPGGEEHLRRFIPECMALPEQPSRATCIALFIGLVAPGND